MPGDTAISIERLPERFLADKSDLRHVRFRLCIGRVTRDVVVDRGSCSVDSPSGEADVEIKTDPLTWTAMDSGELSGVEAFSQRRLSVRGSIETSLKFEPLFDRPAKGGFRYSLERVSLGGIELSTLVAGNPNNPPLVLIHGLGASKASWLPVIPELARTHHLHAIDLPGFGASSKPRGSYDAPWFAEHVFRLLDVLDLPGAFVAGNSLGGRVAMEMAMSEPERVYGIACLCPAAAFTHRPALGLVRVLRPELGVSFLRLPRERLKVGLQDLFCDPLRIQEDWYEAAIDDFRRYWRSPRSRMAFFAALRNVYLDEPDGESGFWARLSSMKTPAMYIYGEHDNLITPRFSQRVRRFLPSAKVLLWEDSGHVPQLEHPERTSQAITEFFSEIGDSQKAWSAPA
jgi:pimeloyl-ACP methyl ester carboxylesterase/putative sterol carrier protein